jgi:hypothetical protein
MEQEVNKMWIGMFGLILVLVTTSSNLLAQTLELKDLSSDCPRAYIVETERNSCAIVHLYTTRGFLENCKATQQRLFDQMLPKRRGCNASMHPDVVVIEFTAESPNALHSFVINRMAYRFFAATRLKIGNGMSSVAAEAGTPGGDSPSFHVVSRLALEESDDISVAVLTPEQAPAWMRDDLRELYQEELEYRRKASENPKLTIEPIIRRASGWEIQLSRDPDALRESIASDVKAPAASAYRTFDYTRESERAAAIANIEKGLSELAEREGRVYRGLWFWSQFRDPRSLRTIFRGNRAVRVGATEGGIYFHNGYPLERGHIDQINILTAWVRVYSSMCSHLLPDPADKLQIKTFTTSGPLINRTTWLSSTDELRFQTGLMGPYVASREESEEKQSAALRGNALAILSSGPGSIMGMARAQVDTYIYALDDFTRFFSAVGCDSPTARQMSQGIALVAHDQSLPNEALFATIAGAESVSDTPQKAGEYRLHSEICWDYDFSPHNVCGCLLDIAKENLGEKDTMVENVDYRHVHSAFMQAPADKQRLCRDPLGAISGGLLSIGP